MNHEHFETMPPKRLFIKLAVPSLVSMLFSSLYMMVDGMFVGKLLGSTALAAINLVFPIIMIVFALDDMIASGTSVKIGIHLGLFMGVYGIFATPTVSGAISAMIAFILWRKSTSSF